MVVCFVVAALWVGCAREGDFDGDPTVGKRLSGNGRAVCGRDGSDDGKAKTVTVLMMRSPRIEALEGQKKTIDLRWGNDRASVGHREHRLTLPHAGRDLDAAADDVV